MWLLYYRNVHLLSELTRNHTNHLLSFLVTRCFLSLKREVDSMCWLSLVFSKTVYYYFWIGRFGKTGTLSIEEMNSNQKSSSKSATSPGTASILDVNKSTLVFIGGLGGQIKVQFWNQYSVICYFCDVWDTPLT